MPNPGTINNPNGRPKGSKNEKTKQWEILQESILERHTQKFNSILDSLDGKEFVETYLKVLSYFKPRLRSIEPSKSDNDINVYYHRPEGEKKIAIDFKEVE